MVSQGGVGKPPVYHLIALNDQGAPMLGAYGAMLALLANMRRGKQAQRVETSLTNASVALQAGEFIDDDGEAVRRPGDTDLRGLSALIRLYPAGCGRWLQIFCPDEKTWQRLRRTPEFESLGSDPKFSSPQKRGENDGDLVHLLTQIFEKKSAREWVDLLQKNGVPAAPAQSADEVLADPHCRETGTFDNREDPQFGMARLVGIGPKFSDIPGIIRRPAPLLGEHTVEVLAELGYSEERIQALKEQKVVYF